MSGPRAAAIPVERIEAPILLLSGDFDELWPSTLGGEQVIKRLRANDFPYKAEHIAYPGAGHMPGSGMLVTSLSTREVRPVAKVVDPRGGTPRICGRLAARRGFCPSFGARCTADGGVCVF